MEKSFLGHLYDGNFLVTVRDPQGLFSCPSLCRRLANVPDLWYVDGRGFLGRDHVLGPEPPSGNSEGKKARPSLGWTLHRDPGSRLSRGSEPVGGLFKEFESNPIREESEGTVGCRR